MVFDAYSQCEESLLTARVALLAEEEVRRRGGREGGRNGSGPRSQGGGRGGGREGGKEKEEGVCCMN